MRILSFFSVVVLLITNMISFVGCSLYEDDGYLVIKDAYIEGIEISISESRPAQVSVVEGYFCGLGLPFFEMHQRQEEDTLYIQITSKVPSSIPCPLGTRDFLRHAWGIGKYEKEISIGEFMPGHYRVVVNDIEGWFFIE